MGQPRTCSQPCCPCFCLVADLKLRAELCPMFPTGWGSKHNVNVVETNYEEYALVATQISKSTGSSTMVLLYSTSAPGPPCCPCHPDVCLSHERRAGFGSFPKLG